MRSGTELNQFLRLCLPTFQNMFSKNIHRVCRVVTRFAVSVHEDKERSVHEVSLLI